MGQPFPFYQQGPGTCSRRVNAHPQIPLQGKGCTARLLVHVWVHIHVHMCEYPHLSQEDSISFLPDPLSSVTAAPHQTLVLAFCFSVPPGAGILIYL